MLPGDTYFELMYEEISLYSDRNNPKYTKLWGVWKKEHHTKKTTELLVPIYVVYFVFKNTEFFVEHCSK